MKKLLFLLFVLILTQNVFSQQGKGLSNAVDNAGFCYVTGYTSNPETGNDILVTKYDYTGDTLWTATYTGDDNLADDKGIAIKTTADGFVYVVGNVGNINSGYDVVILKYNSDGIRQWVTVCGNINSGQDDKAFGIAVDDADNVYITGSSNNPGYQTIFTAKYNSDGVFQWGEFYNRPEQLQAQGSAIVLDHNGNVCVTGFEATTDQGNNIITLKYGPDGGGALWIQVFNGEANSDDKAFGIAVDDNNNIYITGFASNYYASSVVNYDIALLKYTQNGVICWHSYYDGGSGLDDKAFGLVIDDNVLYITGSSATANKGTNYITLEYDLATGNKQWSTTYDGTGGDDQANSIGLIKDDNGTTLGVVVTGRSVGPDNTNDFATMLYSPDDGQAVDSSRYTGTESNDVAIQLAVTESGTVYITGGSDLIVNQRNTSILKNQKLTWGSKLRHNTNISIPVKYTLYQNYPNPFNPSTKIKFDLAKNSLVKLTIYDILGKEVAVPINEFLTSGTHEISYSFTNMSSGTYFYELKTENFRDVKKMMLIK